jgi:hypothetical protein
MSMSQRLTRAFQALSTVELDGQSRFGALGELNMQQVLRDEQLLYVINPIVPVPGKPGRFNESDFLIYAYGNLFCVEIKNWRGRVYYQPTSNMVYGTSFNGPPTPRQTNTGYDTSHVVQEKWGRYGEGPFINIHENPLRKTERFIGRLKRYLCDIDYRFKTYYIRAAVGFSDMADTDISAIYNFDEGIMRTSELASFFERYGRPNAPSQPPTWLLSAFYRMPTWDVVVTKQNECRFVFPTRRCDCALFERRCRDAELHRWRSLPGQFWQTSGSQVRQHQSYCHWHREPGIAGIVN